MKTNVFRRSLHRELWLWLSKHPEFDKQQWPRWKRNGGDVKEPENLCFACDYIVVLSRLSPNCHRCPVVWIDDRCEQFNSEYRQWRDAEGDYDKRTRLALLIADLPVKDGIITDETEVSNVHSNIQ